MKILEVTGRLAEYDVKKAVKDHVDVLVVDINIAAFIKPKLSKTIPACELLTLKLQAEAHDKLQDIETASDYAFKIRDLKIGGGVMKVMAEIVDATRMSEDELIKRKKTAQRNENPRK